MTAGEAALPDWLAHRAAVVPDRDALVADDRTWSYRELDAAVTMLARQLAGAGVGRDSRVATLLRNGTTAAMLVHATLRLGAVLVPLNTRLGEGELAWQLADSAPAVLVTDAANEALARAACRAVPALRLVVGDRHSLMGLDVELDAPVLLAHEPERVAAMVYTSGTTGRPKGAMLTVGNLWWSAVGSALNLGTEPGDRWLACLPLFHIGGLSIVTRAAIYGITAVVHDGFDEYAVNRAIDEQGITTVSVVAVMLQRMLEARGNRPYASTLRVVLLGGGPAPRPLLERAAALSVPVVQSYGLTETTSQLATLAPHDALRKLGSAGRPLYPNELRIEPVPDGAHDGVGEILVRGPVVMAGYAGRPDETARALAGGWLHTGDVGRVDDEGFLYVLDRRDDLIITGGENVYPAEIEAVLLAHPDVVEAGVVGVSDPRWGQRVVAVVRLADGVTGDRSDALREHCRARLAAYKTPRAIEVSTEPLPRTASGKLRRSVLRERLDAR